MWGCTVRECSSQGIGHRAGVQGWAGGRRDFAQRVRWEVIAVLTEVRRLLIGRDARRGEFQPEDGVEESGRGVERWPVHRREGRDSESEAECEAVGLNHDLDIWRGVVVEGMGVVPLVALEACNRGGWSILDEGVKVDAIGPAGTKQLCMKYKRRTWHRKHFPDWCQSFHSENRKSYGSSRPWPDPFPCCWQMTGSGRKQLQGKKFVANTFSPTRLQIENKMETLWQKPCAMLQL